MSNMTRIVVPLALVIAGCSEGPSAVPAKAPSNQAAYVIGGTSADQRIDDITAALNAAWAAKDAAAYAAPFAEDAEVITPLGGILSGRAAIEARHAFLFGGPLASSTQIVSVRRVQFLTGTIAIVDVDAVVTTGAVVSRSLVRWVLTKREGVWEIAAQQSTTIPPAS